MAAPRILPSFEFEANIVPKHSISPNAFPPYAAVSHICFCACCLTSTPRCLCTHKHSCRAALHITASCKHLHMFPPDMWAQTLQLLPAETQKKGYLRLPSLLRMKLVPSLSQGTAPPGWGWWQLAGPVPAQLCLSPWHGAVQGCHCMRGCHQQVTVLCAVRPPIAV